MNYGKVLVVDDDPDIVNLVRVCLEDAGFEVDSVFDGSAAVAAVAAGMPDVVVLDVNLPGLDGLNVCRELRRNHNQPVLFLSARGDDVDKVVGLEVGADDYLAKPFNPRELVARVRALFRRWRVLQSPGSAEESQTPLSHGNLTVDVKAHSVEVRGEPVHLTPTEFSLLHVLATHPGQVLTRQKLLDLVWGDDFYGDERTVDVHVRHVRRKLKKHDPNDYVLSVRGVGYKFEV